MAEQLGREALVAEPAVPPPAPASEPVRPAPPTPVPPRAAIAVVVDARTPAHVAVAEEIEAALSPRRFRVERFTVAEVAELGALHDRQITVVAVGDDAVHAARGVLPDRPLIFCQVADAAEALELGGPTWGVQSTPPLKLQLKHWQNVDPSLRTVALIVSESRAALAAEARDAATALSTDLVVETSGSDRETLYLFRRLTSHVDGLWLLPDNDAFSPQSLRTLLGDAASRGIGVLTFNEALLARGALLSATPVPADVAMTVQHVVERVVAGRTAGMPTMSPLSAAELTINASLAAALGLPPVTTGRWVAREPD